MIEVRTIQQRLKPMTLHQGVSPLVIRQHVNLRMYA